MRTPPRFARLLLRFSRSKADYEGIAGDLFEEFHNGRSAAWFWRQTVSAIGPRFPSIETKSSGGNPMALVSDFRQDVRYSIRTLFNDPGFAIVAVFALALGIGVNTGIFTLLNAVALRPLPVTEADQVVSVYQSFRGNMDRKVNGAISYFSYPEYLDYRDHNQVFSGLAASAHAVASLGGADARRVEGQVVSCNFFSVLGRPPLQGRQFSPEECSKPNAAPVVILSHAFWSNEFRADPNTVGSTILLNRRAFTVIGIEPPDFSGTDMIPSNYWAPLVMVTTFIPGTNTLSDANMSWLEMTGRLKPGVSIARAHANLAIIAGRIDQSYPGRTTALTVGNATLLGEPATRSVVLMGGAVAILTVGLVLLIACANVANLLLARAATRQKEIAIRLSAGASRARLVRQLLTESILLSLTGGVLGSLLAFRTFEVLYKIVLSNLPAGTPPIALNLTPDIRVLGYAFAVSSFTGVLFGLMPALQVTRPDVVSALKKEGAVFAGTRASGGLLRTTLVVVQVSVCLVLLIAAGLLARGLQSAQTVDPGFSMKGVVACSFDLEQQGYDNARAFQFYRQLLERVSLISGVDATSQSVTLPLGGSSYGTVIEVDGVLGPQQVNFNQVSEVFFSLVGIPILRGRGFTQSESQVAVISEATAKRFWPNRDPLGQTFRMGKEKTLFEVVGVAKDIRATDLAHVDKAFLYLPARLDYQKRMSLLVHTTRNVAATAKQIQDAARSIDANIVVKAEPLEDNLEIWRLPSRILASVTGALGFLGLLLASLGIYGVVAYSVSSRIREIGIRMTLGASPAGILGLILGQTMRPVFLGLLIGFAVCASASRLMSAMLYGISPFDPLTFGGVSLLLSGIALLACYIPARRATRVDPMETLRYE